MKAYKTICITILILLNACKDEANENKQVDAGTTNAPISVTFNPKQDYLTNPYTNDSFEVIPSGAKHVSLKSPIPFEAILLEEQFAPKSTELKNYTVLIDTLFDHPKPFAVSPQLQTLNPSQLQLNMLNNPEYLMTYLDANGDTTEFPAYQNTKGMNVPLNEAIACSGSILQINNNQIFPVKALTPVSNAKLDIKSLGVDHGLQSGDVNCMIQDSRDKLWIGTFKGGLHIYDGQHMQCFNRKNGLPDDNITALLEDAAGNIWIGMENGLCKFDGRKMLYFSDSLGLNIANVSALTEGKDSEIWIGTLFSGIIRYQDGSFTHFSEENGLARKIVLDLETDTKGNLWIATAGGLSKFDGNSFLNFKDQQFKQVFEANSITAVQSSGNQVWIGTDNGVYSIQENDLFTYDNSQGLPKEAVVDIVANGKGGVWVAYTDKVTEIQDQTFWQVNHNCGLPQNNIETILFNRAQNLMIGFNKLGVQLIDLNSFRHLLLEDELRGQSVQDIANRNSSHSWWIYSYFNQPKYITQFSGEQINHYQFAEGYTPSDFFISKNNDLWMDLYDGPMVLKEDRFFKYTRNRQSCELISAPIFQDGQNRLWFKAKYQEGNKNDFSLCFKQDDHFFIFPQDSLKLKSHAVNTDAAGNYWLSNDGVGLSHYDGKNITHYGRQQGVPYTHIAEIYSTTDGLLWMYSRNPQEIEKGLGGITCFDGKQFKLYNEESGLSGKHVSNLYEDEADRLWVRTQNGGFSVFQQGRLVYSYSPKSELDLKLASISETAEGGLWLAFSDYANDKGVLKKIKSGIVSTYTVTNGLTNGAFYKGVGQTENGVYWVTTGGITTEAHLLKAKDIAIAKISGLLINEQLIDVFGSENRFDSQDVSPFCNYPQHINLPATSNHITFLLSSQNANLSDEYLFSYYLDGLEKEWSKASKKTVVDYRSLPYGDYEFKVKARTETGHWGPVFSYPLSIQAPWYQSTFAKIVYLLLTFVFVWFLIRFRTQKLRKRQQQLEEEVNKATVVIRSQKEQVEQQKRFAEEQRDEAVKNYEIAEFQRKIVEEKNQEIMDSFNYAKRLQNAILPPPRLVKEWLNDSFIFYKPKDIVAGDFYWMETTKRDDRNLIFFAAADCTGHGVPGAMVSVLCSNALNQAINDHNITSPGPLLDKVAELVSESFAQSEQEVKDGMDIAVCAIDLIERTVWFAGANNSLYRITDIETKINPELKVFESERRKLIEYKADKQPVGEFEHRVPFTTVQIKLEPGDCIYLFSDGFADQFGGEKGKKYKYANFKRLLLDIESKEMDTQKDILDVEFERWKGDMEQVDDICIIGLRVNGHMRKLFSDRELEIIQKIKDGKQSKEIADELSIAKSTVDTHRKRILAKVNLNNAAELIKFCNEHEVL